MNESTFGGLLSKLDSLASTYSNLVSLIPSDGDAVLVSKDALRQCAFFDNLFIAHPNLDKYLANVSSETLETLSAFLSGKRGDVELKDTFEAILFGRQIKWIEFIRYCCKMAVAVEAPASPKADEVSFVIQSLVKFLPTRTFEHYEGLVKKLTIRLSPTETYRIILSMTQAIRQKDDTLIEPLPVPLFQRKATVALMHDVAGKPMTAILNKTSWLPVNIFGPNFNPVKEEVKRFHLVFGRYVVYENGNGQVIAKSLLLADEPGQIIFTSCKFFRSRCNQLHVITAMTSAVGSQVDCLYEWNHETLSFETKFSHAALTLKTAHRAKDARLKIVLGRGDTIVLSADDSATLQLENLKSEKRLEPTYDDCVDNCYLYTGATNYSAKRGAAGDLELTRPVHVGYTLANVDWCGFNRFSTKVYTDEWRPYGDSEPHGVVDTMSDVLLVYN